MKKERFLDFEEKGGTSRGNFSLHAGGALFFDLQLFSQEKTEEATPRKKKKEREEGHVAQSKDLTSAFGILGGIVTLFALSKLFWEAFKAYLVWVFQWASVAVWDEGEWAKVTFSRSGAFFLKVWFPVALVCSIILVFVLSRQVGFAVTFKPLVPSFERFSLVRGLKRMFSLRSLVEAIKGIIKAAILFGVLYFGLRKEIPVIRQISYGGVYLAAGQVFMIIFRLIVRLGVALLVLGVFDLGYQKWEFARSIRMTKQEVKEEFKQTEGDPFTKQRIRRRQSEIARQRMISQVPQADVVLTNPTHLAVALKYDRATMNAPKVVAKGAGYIALRIREIAENANVPIVEDKPLARALYRNVDVGEEIPESLYVAIAEVLAYVYSLKKERQEKTYHPV